jgi:inosine-uridine nucleoside N-ribohydrolase
LTHKVIIDADPGISDALAVTLALCDPQLDVVALTAVGGRVSAAQAGHNLLALVQAIDPPKWPRFGIADSPEAVYELVRFSERYGDAADLSRRLNGESGLGDWPTPDAALHHPRSAVKLLLECSREAPGEITLITLGPLTNVALACDLDPEFPSRLKRIVCLAGAMAAPGDLTPVGEFNVCFHPQMARRVLRYPATKTLVPLDVGRKAVFTFDHVQKLDLHDGTAYGRLLKSLLPFALRTHHQHLGMEGLWALDLAAIAAVAQPQLFRNHSAAVDVETEGLLTRGMTVFDQRPQREWRPNIEVLSDVDAQGLLDYVLSQFRRATTADEDE